MTANPFLVSSLEALAGQARRPGTCIRVRAAAPSGGGRALAASPRAAEPDAPGSAGVVPHCQDLPATAV